MFRIFSQILKNFTWFVYSNICWASRVVDILREKTWSLTLRDLCKRREDKSNYNIIVGYCNENIQINHYEKNGAERMIYFERTRCYLAWPLRSIWQFITPSFLRSKHSGFRKWANYTWNLSLSTILIQSNPCIRLI